jgi:hypothetical protein
MTPPTEGLTTTPESGEPRNEAKRKRRPGTHSAASDGAVPTLPGGTAFRRRPEVAPTRHRSPARPPGGRSGSHALISALPTSSALMTRPLSQRNAWIARVCTSGVKLAHPSSRRKVS